MKKYKYLLVSGCSFPLGRGTSSVKTDDYKTYVSEEHRFSKLLSDKLGSTEINIAKGGSSNRGIINRAYQWIEENNDKCKDTLVVLGTSHFYRDVTEIVEMPKSILKILKSNKNETFEMQKQTMTYNLLIHYLKSNGCDVIYFNSFDNFNLSATQLKFDDNNTWFKWLEKNHGKRAKGFQQYTHSPDRWYGSDNAHPGIKSHKKIADDLYEVIKTL